MSEPVKPLEDTNSSSSGGSGGGETASNTSVETSKPELVTFSGDTNEPSNNSHQPQAASATKPAEQKLHAPPIPDFIRNNWDPLSSHDWDNEKPTVNCIHRIKKDIYNLYQEPAPGICVIPDNNDITKIYALITGPFDTPYEGGFFYFLIRCPPNYPFKPPRVRLMTTSNGTTRFNPNLYKNGKVCLSILGTWEGPAWLPSQSIASVLISIQSLMNSNPYFNEPGYQTERQPNAAKYYNDIIRHETIRVAVCENLENEHFEPKLIRNVMVSSFVEYYDYYIETCKSNLHKDNEEMTDLLFNEKRGNFKYGELLKRLEKLKAKIDVEKLNEDNEDDDDDDDDEDETENNDDAYLLTPSEAFDESKSEDEKNE